MTGKIDKALLARGWLHAHEEDTQGKLVFRPDTAALPPSRGRDGYRFSADGTAVRIGSGPSDRGTSTNGTWTIDPQGRVELRLPGMPNEVLNIESLDSDRLILRK